jgi:hypothetical protein
MTDELHGPECAREMGHEDCDNGEPCRQTNVLGDEPPDIYHECGSPEHFTLPEPEDT